MANETSMRRLTSAEIFGIVWSALRNSQLAIEVPSMYADHFPEMTTNSQLTGEFIVVSSLTNSLGDIQVATVNVNIYVPDVTPTIDRIEQRYPDRKRLSELASIAYKTLAVYPKDERYYFDVLSDTLLSEEDISYSFINLKVQIKNY